MSAAEERIATARRWLGVPFCVHGRSLQGVDCIGVALAALGGSVIVPNDYDVRNGSLLVETMRRLFRRVTRARAGDFVLVSPRRGEPPRHIALVTGDSIIHCTPRTRVVVEQPYCGPWLRLTHSAWRP